MGTKTLCGSPEKIGDWAEIKDWGAFDTACRANKDMLESALLFSSMSWQAHQAVRKSEDKPVNHNYESSYSRIRALAVEIMGERDVKKVETGVKNVVTPRG